MTLLVTTFGSWTEFRRGTAALDRLALSYKTISPEPGYRLVAAPALVVDEEVRRALVRTVGSEFLCAGWVEYSSPTVLVPASEPRAFSDGLFERATISVLAPCVAGSNRIRIIAQVAGDPTRALPYLNAIMDRASYNPRDSILTFMDGHRMVAIHPHRITIAKADEIIDAWRTLEEVRIRLETAWEARAHIEPSYETRARPPALEIFKRLPRTNCKTCGEATCLAFAVRVWSGERPATDCLPVYAESGDKTSLRDALNDVCGALGL